MQISISLPKEIVLFRHPGFDEINDDLSDDQVDEILYKLYEDNVRPDYLGRKHVVVAIFLRATTARNLT